MKVTLVPRSSKRVPFLFLQTKPKIIFETALKNFSCVYSIKLFFENSNEIGPVDVTLSVGPKQRQQNR